MNDDRLNWKNLPNIEWEYTNIPTIFKEILKDIDDFLDYNTRFEILEKILKKRDELIIEKTELNKQIYEIEHVLSIITTKFDEIIDNCKHLHDLDTISFILSKRCPSCKRSDTFLMLNLFDNLIYCDNTKCRYEIKFDSIQQLKKHLEDNKIIIIK